MSVSIQQNISMTLKWSSPGFFAAPIRAFLVEINCPTQDCSPVWVSLTFDRKPIVNMSTLFKQVKELVPKLPAFASIQECLGVPNQDQGITGPGKENIQTLW